MKNHETEETCVSLYENFTANKLQVTHYYHRYFFAHEIITQKNNINNTFKIYQLALDANPVRS